MWIGISKIKDVQLKDTMLSILNIPFSSIISYYMLPTSEYLNIDVCITESQLSFTYNETSIENTDTVFSKNK
jgi:hypothetical protein